MFDFLKRQPAPIGHLERLGVDMHAHWLPGLDDGAQDIEESLVIIRAMAAMGYHKLIATPHVMADLYPNTSESIRNALALTRKRVAAEGIDIVLDAAAEYLLDEGFEQRLERDDILTLPGKHVLVEFSFVSPPPTRDALFFKMLAKGYIPVLAHPERYHFYHDKFFEYRELHNRGVKLQINLLSLTGYYGKSVQKVAHKIIREGMSSILGSDAHNERHLEELKKLINSGKFSRAIIENSWHNQSLFS